MQLLLAKMLNDPTYGAGCWSTLVGRVVPEYIDRNFHGKSTGDVVSGLSNTGRAAPVIAANYPQRLPPCSTRCALGRGGIVADYHDGALRPRAGQFGGGVEKQC